VPCPTRRMALRQACPGSEHWMPDCSQSGKKRLSLLGNGRLASDLLSSGEKVRLEPFAAEREWRSLRLFCPRGKFRAGNISSKPSSGGDLPILSLGRATERMEGWAIYRRLVLTRFGKIRTRRPPSVLAGARDETVNYCGMVAVMTTLTMRNLTLEVKQEWSRSGWRWSARGGRGLGS
jgi:hypothetical protein